MKFELVIKLETPRFDLTNHDVARALRDAAERLEDEFPGEMQPGDTGKIAEPNTGTQVGHWSVVA